MSCKRNLLNTPTRRELLKCGLYGSLAYGLSSSLWLGGCSKPRKEKRPNIVLIVMDTVKQDHLSCYGYDRNTTPNLNNLAEKSRVYLNAYSVSSWTAPSHASLFTGLYPIAHQTTQESWDLDKNITTLAEILALAGYKTIGIAENAMLTQSNNFDKGFSDYYETWKIKLPKAKKNENVDFLLFQKHLEQIAQDDNKNPFFTFINLNRAHNPYNSSNQFINTFVSNPSIKIYGHDRLRYYLDQRKYSPVEFRHLKQLYDAEILYVDHIIGKMIQELKLKNCWEDTIFIVTSDHGENIGDHEHVDHVFSLYQTTTKIPLIIHYPPLFEPNSRDTDNAQLVDIFPTLLNILGIEGNSQGHDLLAPNAREKRDVFCEYYRPVQAFRAYRKQKNHEKLKKYNRRIRSLIRGDMKLIWASDHKHELYSLAKDPAEQNNIINSPAYTNVKLELINRINNLTAAYDVGREKLAIPSEKRLDEKTIKALKSLGYL